MFLIKKLNRELLPLLLLLRLFVFNRRKKEKKKKLERKGNELIRECNYRVNESYINYENYCNNYGKQESSNYKYENR